MIELKKIINIFKNNKFETCTEIEYYNIRIIIKLAKETFLIIYEDKLEFTTYFAFRVNTNNIFYLEKYDDYKLISKINYFLKIFYDIEFDLYNEYFTITEEEFLSNKEFLRNLKVLADKYNIEFRYEFFEDDLWIYFEKEKETSEFLEAIIKFEETNNLLGGYLIISSGNLKFNEYKTLNLNELCK